MSQRSSLLDQANTWGTFIFANLAWVLLALPLVTAPLATAGLFQVMSKWVRGKQPEFFLDFFGGMRQHWLKAYGVGLLDLVVGGIVVANLIILSMMGEVNAIAIMSGSAAIVAGLILVLTNLYLWSLLVIAEIPLPQIMKLAFKLVMVHPLWSLGILIAGALPLVIGLFVPVLFLLLGAVSLSAWIINRGTWHIIRRYLPEDERQEFEAPPLSQQQ